jgi:hypothetical protein
MLKGGLDARDVCLGADCSCGCESPAKQKWTWFNSLLENGGFLRKIQTNYLPSKMIELKN